MCPGKFFNGCVAILFLRVPILQKKDRFYDNRFYDNEREEKNRTAKICAFTGSEKHFRVSD